jgi:hypothetical protein
MQYAYIAIIFPAISVPLSVEIKGNFIGTINIKGRCAYCPLCSGNTFQDREMALYTNAVCI